MGKNEKEIKKWNILCKHDDSLDLVTQLLKNRGISDVERFLNPPKVADIFKYFDPAFKKSLSDAKKLIDSCILEKFQIVVYGDYDADGVCATAILYNTIRFELNYENCSFFIPNRFDHGYGLSVKAFDEILAGHEGRKLLFITVDTGITGVKEIEYVKKLGHKVIITDHHQKPGVLPPADVLVWNDKIVGSTISWILSKVLGSRNRQTISLAALATVTDLQPLLDFNRSLVKEGLAVMNSNPPVGIKRLLELSGRKDTEVSSYDMGFVLGPRLNASGRIQDATRSLRLLIEEDPALIDEYAKELNDVNVQRQDKTLEMYDMIQDVSEGETPRIIISAHTDYHEGIIGLVAAKLMQKYYRPSIVMSLMGDHARGSVRSIPGIDIIAILRKFDKLFTNLGGHPMAAGFTIPVANIDDLKASLTDYFEVEFTDAHFEPSIDVDMEIPISGINGDLFSDISRLKPFGVANREPVFASFGVSLIGTSKVGKDSRHLVLRLFNDGTYYKAIFFGVGELYDDLSAGDKLDLAYTIKENVFNGKVNLDLIIVDVKKA